LSDSREFGSKKYGSSQWVDGLRTLLEESPTTQAAPQLTGGRATAGSAVDFDSVTLRESASEVSQPAIGESVRWEKVAFIRAALAAGTYFVSADAVAAKLVESMLSGGHSPPGEDAAGSSGRRDRSIGISVEQSVLQTPW
jgi:flagellar biosynthesis anti-sigma factor FlgM